MPSTQERHKKMDLVAVWHYLQAKFNVADAKSRFSELVQKAMVGEEVIIAKANKPVVKLVPLVGG